MEMKNWKESPCTHCCRVPDGNKCDNKDCARWRKWFLYRWEQLRTRYLKEGQQ